MTYTGSNFSTWFSNEVIDLICQKIRAHAIFKASGKLEGYINFSFLRAKNELTFKDCYKIFIQSNQECSMF